jgi:hypothetical protein
MSALKRAEARAPERGVYAASAAIVFGVCRIFYAPLMSDTEEPQLCRDVAVVLGTAIKARV